MNAAPILTATDAKRIAAIGARLASDHDGEIANAGRALVRQLGKHDLRISDVLERALTPRRDPGERGRYQPGPVSPQADHQRDALNCVHAPPGVLTEWEVQFAASIADRRSISPRQREVLSDIVAKVRRHQAAGGAR